MLHHSYYISITLDHQFKNYEVPSAPRGLSMVSYFGQKCQIISLTTKRNVAQLKHLLQCTGAQILCIGQHNVFVIHYLSLKKQHF